MPAADATSTPQQEFQSLITHHLRERSWVKLVLSKYRGPEPELQRVMIRRLDLRDQPALSFVYSYKNRDVTKNLGPEAGLEIIQNLLLNDFKNAHFLSTDSETQLEISKKGKAFLQTRTVETSAATIGHNREKNRFVDIDRAFLTALGITDQRKQLIPAMAHKWKQINKFIEIFSQAVTSSALALERPLHVVDFGSGKGYLTFALHDYLHSVLNNTAHVVGVELRETLVNFCNQTAATLQQRELEFVCGDVKTHAPKNVDVMIALHACDVATDYAIHYGIRANAAIIMCSPCCHKEIRQQLQSPALLKPMLKYGIHAGQQAEMITDSLRALLLEANGYATKVFEFISLEHTDKNKMILAIKKQNAGDNRQVLEQIAALKEFYGIKQQQLETLLQTDA